MKVIEDLDLYAKLLNSVHVGGTNRPLTPFEVSTLIDKMVDECGSKTEVLERLPIKSDMLELFLKLQEMPKGYQNVIVWGTSTTEGISFSSAGRIVGLKDSRDKEILSDAAMMHKFLKTDIENIVSLKNKTKISIEDCIEKVVKFRPVIEHRYMFIFEIDPNFVRRLTDEPISKEESPEIILKNLVSRFISHEDILAVVIRDNKLVFTFNQNGYNKIQEILKEKKFVLNQLLAYFLKKEI